jgi:hypothetical protein
MPAKQYRVTLTAEERTDLTDQVNKGQGQARRLRRARIILMADEAQEGGGWKDADIAKALDAQVRTVERTRQKCVQEGIEAALNHTRANKSRRKVLDGAAEARLTQLACSQAPAGRESWSLQLLADKLIELEVVETVSRETVRTTLKNELKPWLKEQGCIPEGQSAELVCAMEDVLEVYHRPYDPKRPQVCFDEASKHQTKESRLPLPVRPGQVAKYDYEYERNDTSNLFIFFAPLQAWRHIKVTDQRTMVDFAHCMRDLVDLHFPEADKLVLVMDNLNTHKLASLYEAFAPAEARRIIEKLEIHYTPKHGSWLNMAEIELSVLQRQCLKARIPDQTVLIQKVTAWQARRNTHASTVHWRFTTDDVRIKLHRLYPSIDPC